MAGLPVIDTLTLPELRALDVALLAAIKAAQVAGGGFEAALLLDAEGASIIFTVPIGPEPHPQGPAGPGSQPGVPASQPKHED